MWKEKTWWIGGGDVPCQNKRYYRYRFRERWWMRFKSYEVKIKVPFETQERALNGDRNGHFLTLKFPDFDVNGTNLMEWARETIHTGKAEFLFFIDAGDPFEELIHQLPVLYELTARFSSKSHAAMFKLIFG